MLPSPPTSVSLPAPPTRPLIAASADDETGASAPRPSLPAPASSALFPVGRHVPTSWPPETIAVGAGRERVAALARRFIACAPASALMVRPVRPSASICAIRAGDVDRGRGLEERAADDIDLGVGAGGEIAGRRSPARRASRREGQRLRPAERPSV